MADPDPSSTIASPAAPPPGGGQAGLSGQSSPSLGGIPPAGDGAPTPTPTAQAPGGNMQPGLLAVFRHLMGVSVKFMDMAIRLGPDGEDRDDAINHFKALSKKFKSQDPMAGQGQGGGPGQGIGLPQGLGGGAGGLPPGVQPGTPNLPRGPMQMPTAPGGLAG